MLGSRQTRPSDPTAGPVFGLRVLSAGMVTSPKPMPCLLMHVPTPCMVMTGRPHPVPKRSSPERGGRQSPSCASLWCVPFCT